MFLPFLLVSCSLFSTPTPVPAPAPIEPLHPVDQAKANDLESMTIATLGKMTSDYADIIYGRSGMSSLIYFSGAYTGMTEINGFPQSAGGVVILRDNEPLWYSMAPNGDLLLSGNSGSTPGKALPNGGKAIAGKNDIADPEITDFVFFVAEMDDAELPTAVTLFRGWWAVHVNSQGDIHHALMTRSNRNIMLLGLAPGTVVQVGLIEESTNRVTAENSQEATFDLTELRGCTVPREGFTSVSWSTCSLTMRR